MRKIIAAVVGIAVAVLTVMLIQWISHTVFPPPAGIDYEDAEQVAAYMAAAPIPALLIVAFGYMMATFDGVFVACLIARSQAHIYALVVGGMMLAATIANLLLIPHPVWFSATSIGGILVFAWLAMKIAPVAKETLV